MGIKTSSPRGRGTASKSTSKPRSSGPASGTGRIERCREAAERANHWLTERSLLSSHPWKGLVGLPRKIVDGSHYVGTNVFVLLAEQDSGKLMSALWGSFKALKEKGLTVKRDSVHTDAIYFGRRQPNAGQSGSRTAGATGVAPEDAAVPSGDDGVTTPPSSSSAPSGSRIMQPVQLFNVAQCVEFNFDPGPAQADITGLLTRWSDCRVAAQSLRKWLEEATTSDPLEQHETELVERLGADIAFMRRTGAMDVIAERLPAVPDLGMRFMKVSGVAYSLSKAIEERVFGPTQQNGQAAASSSAVSPPAPSASSEVPEAAPPVTPDAAVGSASESTEPDTPAIEPAHPGAEGAPAVQEVLKPAKRARSPRRMAKAASPQPTPSPDPIAEANEPPEQPDWLNSW
ncbi:ArdC-like ssDNA-binding domain-containing protein [Burkholderia anthina]|uniref:ArdC-like ssDNA-binding domain-containing protein n=1 Tax=Burkholderia anthina TaxID=179879 RepID=UPI0037BE6FC7